MPAPELPAEGRCLARFGPHVAFHTRAGDCPIMSSAEWRSVSVGIRGSWSLLGPYLAALRAEQDAEDEAREKAEKLSREERMLRQRSEDAAAQRKREEKGRRAVREGYAYRLWILGEGQPRLFPARRRRRGERLVAWRLALGCRCAAAGPLECADAEECLRRVREGRG